MTDRKELFRDRRGLESLGIEEPVAHRPAPAVEAVGRVPPSKNVVTNAASIAFTSPACALRISRTSGRLTWLAENSDPKGRWLSAGTVGAVLGFPGPPRSYGGPDASSPGYRGSPAVSSGGAGGGGGRRFRRVRFKPCAVSPSYVAGFATTASSSAERGSRGRSSSVPWRRSPSFCRSSEPSDRTAPSSRRRRTEWLPLLAFAGVELAAAIVVLAFFIWRAPYRIVGEQRDARRRTHKTSRGYIADSIAHSQGASRGASAVG